MPELHRSQGPLMVLLLAATFLLAGPATGHAQNSPTSLGQFSVSLTVKDVQASKAFYEKLGFGVFQFEGGAPAGYGKAWVILTNGAATIGLFQGMFDKNTLTFNPKDVREVQRSLKKQGLTFAREADESKTGPDFAMLFDPDGNPVLLDQH